MRKCNFIYNFIIFIKNFILIFFPSEAARKRAKRNYLIVYIFLYLFGIFGMINTQWIALVFDKNNREHEYASEFYMATILDYTVYQISLIVWKTIVYFLIVKDKKKTWWKNFLITVISAFTWGIAIFG